MKLLLYLLLIGGALTLVIAAKPTSSPTSPKPTNGTTIATVKPETLKALMDKVYDFVSRGINPTNLPKTIWNWESIPTDQLKDYLTDPKDISDIDLTDVENPNVKNIKLIRTLVQEATDKNATRVNVYYTAQDVFNLAKLAIGDFNRSAPMEDIYEQTLVYGKIYAEVIHINPQSTFESRIKAYPTKKLRDAWKTLPNFFNETTPKNYAPYYDYIQKYGVYFIKKFSLGGVIHLQAWISPIYFSTSLKNNTDALKKLLRQKFDHDLYGNASEPTELIDPKNQNNIGYRFYGGNTALTDPKQWNATIHTHRTIVSFQFGYLAENENQKKPMLKASRIEDFRYELNRFRNTFQKSKGLISTMFPVGPYPFFDPDFLINVTDRYLQMKPFPNILFNDGMFDEKALPIFKDFLNYTMFNR